MINAVFDLFTQDTIRSRALKGVSALASRSQSGSWSFTMARSRWRVHGELPRIAATIDSNEAATLDTPALATKRVLVIDDNADIRESLGLLLRMWGHGVDFAETGPDGLERADDVHPDIALIDIGLPGLSGYDVARSIRGRSDPWAKAVKLVALTGYGREADRDAAFDAGFDCHLVKPIDPDVLARTLKLR